METQQINSASVGQPKCETNIKSKYLFHRLTRQVARWSVSFFPIPFRRLKYHSVSFRTLPPSSRDRCAGTLATNASVKTALWQPPEQTFENRFETFIRLMFQCEFEYSKILDFNFKYLILKVMKKKNVQVPVTSKIRMSRRSTWNQSSIVDIRRVKLTVKKCVRVCMITITNIGQP